MPWNELLQLTLFGTERRVPSSRLLHFLEEKGLDTELDDATLVLAATAFLGPLKKGAQQFSEWEDALPVPPPRSTEKLIPARAFSYLRQMLEGRFRPALPEFLRLAQQGGWTLPPECLPALLEQALGEKSLWQWVKPVLSERGRWLVHQHPEWNRLLKSKKPKPPSKLPEMQSIPGSDLLDEQDPAYRQLLASDSDWPPALSRRIIEGLQQSLAVSSGLHWESRHYKELLQKAAYHSDPGLGNDFSKGWPTERSNWGWWEPEVNHFLEILSFRRHLQQVLMQNEKNE